MALAVTATIQALICTHPFRRSFLGHSFTYSDIASLQTSDGSRRPPLTPFKIAARLGISVRYPFRWSPWEYDELLFDRYVKITDTVVRFSLLVF